MKEFFEKYGELFEQNPKSYRVFLESVTDVVASIALYVALAVAFVLVLWAVVIRNRDEQYLAGARKIMLGIMIGFTVAVIAVLGSFRLYAEIIAEHFTWHGWLLVGLFVLVVAAVTTTVVLHSQGKKGYKWAALAFSVAILIYVVVVLCVVKPVDDSYVPGIPTIDASGEGYVVAEGSSWLMYVVSAVLVVAIAVLALLGGNNSEFNTKSLTYAAICVSLSFALSYIKFFSLPQGGSVTFASLLPLALYSYMFGTRKGVVAGAVYGLLQFVQSPQFYQPMQVLLDYPIAFAAIGLAGIGRKMKFLKGNVRLEFALGTTIAVLFRYVSHVLSGYFVFYAWSGSQHPLAYSLAYNSFTMVDLAVVLVVGIVALSSRTLRKAVVSADCLPEQTEVVA